MVSLALSKGNILQQRSVKSTGCGLTKNDVASFDCLLWSNIKLKKACNASVDAAVTALY